MTRERMEEIFAEDILVKWYGDNAYQGLQILAKYTKHLITGADHDIIYSEDIENLIKAGITEEDCIKLRGLNWIIDSEWSGCLACYV